MSKEQIKQLEWNIRELTIISYIKNGWELVGVNQ